MESSSNPDTGQRIWELL